MLWTEKYRPKTSENFEAPEHIKKYLNTPSNQHLLLYGPPGSGKTTFSHIIAHNTSVLELNASDERGIAVVRTKIKTFASGINKKKTIILDECDNLTNDAQQCLRRIIEDYSQTTRFIFITNYLSRIIGPVKSRLFKIKFDYQPTSYKYVQYVGESEGIEKPDSFYSELFTKCNYDLRKSINLLQGIFPIINNLENIDDWIGILPQKIIDQFLNLKSDEIVSYVDNFIKESYSFSRFLSQLNSESLDDRYRNLFHMKLSEIEGKIFAGCQTEILLYDLCYSKVEIWNTV